MLRGGFAVALAGLSGTSSALQFDSVVLWLTDHSTIQPTSQPIIQPTSLLASPPAYQPTNKSTIQPANRQQPMDQPFH
jgi:hypothetical protein